jgi:hypothetical protein
VRALRPIASLVLALAACAGTGEASPPPAASGASASAPKDPAMTPLDRYRAYLKSDGVRVDTAQVVEEGALALGGFHFYRVADAGAAEHRAAVSADGLVGGRRDPADAWWALLGAGDAAALADRVAWLSSTADLDRHARGVQVTVVAPGARRVQASIDPALWRAAPAPALRTAGDARTLVAWLYTRGADEPVELTITAHATGAATLRERPAHELVAPGDPVARATAALAGDDDELIQWALLYLPQRGATTAAPAIATLLASPVADRRAAAASALAVLASPDAVAPLAAAAGKEGDPTALTAELQALGHIKTAASARALGSLRAALTSDRRVEAIHALAAIGAAARAEVKAGLADAAAHDRDPDLRALAASYLRDLTP